MKCSWYFPVSLFPACVFVYVSTPFQDSLDQFKLFKRKKVLHKKGKWIFKYRRLFFNMAIKTLNLNTKKPTTLTHAMNNIFNFYISSIKLNWYLTIQVNFSLHFQLTLQISSIHYWIFFIYCDGRYILLKVVIMSINYFRVEWQDFFLHIFTPLFLLFITGNDILHYLLSQGVYKMRMDMIDFDNQTRYVTYSYFNVEDEAFNYRVTLFLLSGNVGEISQSFVFYHFSTKKWLLFWKRLVIS